MFFARSKSRIIRTLNLSLPDALTTAQMLNTLHPTLQDQIRIFELELKRLTIKLLISKYSNQYQNSFSKRLSRLAVSSEISLKQSYSEEELYSVDNVKSEFDLIKRLMKIIIRFSSRLEEREYLASPELKLKISSYLTCIYDIEGSLKRKVYKGMGQPTNPEILDNLVRFSHEAMASRLRKLHH